MDTYSVAETARLLGVSPKRVRQLVEEGKLLPVEGSTPLQVQALSVLEERERRKESPPRPGPAPAVNPLEPSEILAMASEIASSVARESVRLALEAAEPARKEAEAVRDRTEESLRVALAEAEARAAAAEAELERLRSVEKSVEIVQTEEPRRRFWRRGGK